MLKCLFPTKYPYKRNIKTSYDTKIRNYPQFDLDSTQTFMKLFRYFKNDEEDAKAHPEYSYLKLNGKIYTITEVIWMNDIFNHPVYKLLVNEYYNLIIFNNKYKEKIKKIIDKKLELIKEFKNESVTQNFKDVISDFDTIKNHLTPQPTRQLNQKKKEDVYLTKRRIL
jgi:DNA-directed RNA polymerase beta' subunit